VYEASLFVFLYKSKQNRVSSMVLP